MCASKLLSSASSSEKVLTNWRAFEVSLQNKGQPWTRHLVGWSQEDQQGQVSSAIQSYDSVTGQFRTQSGRLFRAVGPPGMNGAAIFAWIAWKLMSGVAEEFDVTDEVLARTSASLSQLQACQRRKLCRSLRESRRRSL